MKKLGKMSSIAALSLSAVLGLGSFAAIAQTAPNDGSSDQKTVKRERRGGGRFGKHHRGGKRRGGMMFAKLNLSEEQKAQLKELRQTSRESVKPVRDELRAKRRELRQSKTGGTFNEGLAAQKLSEMAPLQAKLMGEKLKLRQAMQAILTPEQKTQLETARAERKANREERKAKLAERRSDRNTETQND
jgi:protein CpxP